MSSSSLLAVLDWWGAHRTTVKMLAVMFLMSILVMAQAPSQRAAIGGKTAPGAHGTTTIPEPASFGMMGAGLVLAAVCRRRKSVKA